MGDAREGGRGTPLPGAKVRGSQTGRPIMALLDLISRRSLLRIGWELRGGAMTFRALREACDNLSPTLLNRRLKEMREARLVERTLDGYGLTPLGQSFWTAFEPVYRWSDVWAAELSGSPGKHSG
jgi:DNA-binding HxlR family transcriptional regulator